MIHDDESTPFQSQVQVQANEGRDGVPPLGIRNGICPVIRP